MKSFVHVDQWVAVPAGGQGRNWVRSENPPWTSDQLGSQPAASAVDPFRKLGSFRKDGGTGAAGRLTSFEIGFLSSNALQRPPHWVRFATGIHRPRCSQIGFVPFK